MVLESAEPSTDLISIFAASRSPTIGPARTSSLLRLMALEKDAKAKGLGVIPGTIGYMSPD
jgi:hypothetical protein